MTDADADADVPDVPAAAAPTPARARRRWALVGAGMVAVASVAAAGWGVTEHLTGLPDGAVLAVGDTVVTEEGFRRQLAVLEVLHGTTPPPDGAAAPDGTAGSDGTAGADRDRFDREAARAAAVALVVEQEAQRQGVTVTDAEVDAAVARMVAARHPDRAAYLATLGRLGVTEADVRGEVRRELAGGRLAAQVVAGVPAATDAEVRHAYGERPPVSAERRRLLNIVVGSHEEAEQVLAQARAGADWGALAVRFSRDDATRDTGGELGERAADQLEPEYARAAFAVGAGEFFGPVRSRDGWNAGHVVGVQSGVPLPFEEAAGVLRTRLRAEREAAVWEGFLRPKVAAADVEYAGRYRPADPTALHAPR